jgi:hypothetical protein
MKFKGEEYAAMTGLVAGAIGISLFLIIDIVPHHIPEQLILMTNIVFVTLLLLSLVIKFSSIFTHHAVTTPNTDDFILGFAIGFDIPLVIVELANGHLPFLG